MSARDRLRAVHPGELAALGILGVVIATLVVAVARGAALRGQTAFHAALFVGIAALSIALARRPAWRWAPQLRGIAVIGVMFVLYGTLGRIAFEAVPWLGDPVLDRADRALFLGRSPSLLFASQPSPRSVEFLGFYYAAYIPYVYMSIFLGLVARPPGERDEFVTAFALLYALGFLGYLFVPARGPVVALAGEFGTDLRGGFFHGLILESVERVGGPHGAFPSLHMGASFLVVGFDVRHRNLLRGLIYVPLVTLIAAATIVLRYHWVVDLVAGAALALLANHLAPKLVERWRSRTREPAT